MAEKSCYTCKFFAEMKEPYKRTGGATVYGYCFKGPNNDYSQNMGNGYAVFLPGVECKDHKRRRET